MKTRLLQEIMSRSSSFTVPELSKLAGATNHHQ